MENAWPDLSVYTSSGCSDRNEHPEIDSHALEVNVVCIAIPRYDLIHFVVLT
jgi:hypothetical protein